MFGSFNLALAKRLRHISLLDICCARGLAASAALLQAWGHGATVSQIHRAFEAGSQILVDQTYMQMHLRIAGALVLTSISLWFRRAFAFYLSLFSAAWVLLEYLRWYLRSRTILVSAGIENWPAQTPHALDSLWRYWLERRRVGSNSRAAPMAKQGHLWCRDFPSHRSSPLMQRRRITY